jgi:hypothetical protein
MHYEPGTAVSSNELKRMGACLLGTHNPVGGEMNKLVNKYLTTTSESCFNHLSEPEP